MTDWAGNQRPEGFENSFGTPEYIVKPLADVIGGYDLDPAARPAFERDEAGPAAERHCDELVTKFDEPDGLEIEWHGDVWLNPPYGRTENPTWAEKIRDELDNVDRLTCIIPQSTSADWFQRTYREFDYFVFLGHRVKYKSGDSFAPAGFDSLVALYGDYPPEYFDVLRRVEPPEGKDVVGNIVTEVRP